MIVLALAAILLHAAAPSLRETLDQHRLRAAGSDLLAAVQMTRVEALGRGRTVTLAADGGDWRRGWSIYVDANGNGRRDSDEPPIASHGALPAGATLRARFTEGPVLPAILYNAAGRSCKASNHRAANFGTLALQLGEQQRNLIINMQGRARLCDPARERSSCASAAE